MRPPDFWAGDGRSPWPALLAPAGMAWAAAARLRRRLARTWTAPVPVLCVGNLVAGGAGKTPAALALAGRLAAGGRRVALLSRGYGGRLTGPLRVDPERHDAADVGDEPLLLARAAPTWIGADRAASARAAVADGADILILDDGHQNPGLAKDLSIVVVDAGFGFGNGRVLPAGPLREPVDEGLARAGALLLIGDGRARPAAQRAAAAAGIPLLHARLAPVAPERLAGQAVVAFAGIGRPDKFFATLREIGCRIVAEQGFPDHHRYHPDEVMRLVQAAAAEAAVPVTTAKDWVRLPEAARPMVRVLEVELRFAEPDALDLLLAPLTAARSR